MPLPVLVPPAIDQSPPHHDNPSPAPVPSLIDWDKKNSPGPAPEVVKPPSALPSPSPFPLKKSGGSALVGVKVWLISVVLLAQPLWRCSVSVSQDLKITTIC